MIYVRVSVPPLTYEAAVGLTHTLEHAGLHLLGQLWLPLARCIVAGKAKGFGAIAEYIIDTHGHQIDANAAIASSLLGNLQLGANAIGAQYEHWILVVCWQTG